MATYPKGYADTLRFDRSASAGREMPFGALAPLMPDDVTTLHPTLLLGAVARRMRHLGRRRPPLVVIDDAHLLDELSAATLLGLVTAGAARVVATIRSGERAPDAVNALSKNSYVSSVAIEAFDRRRTGEFLVARLGGAVAVTTAELLWQQTRGNALYLEEITRHAIARGELVKHGGVWIWEGQPTVPTRPASCCRAQLVDLDSMAAQVTVFSAQPREALAITERILAADPPRATEIRTRSSRHVSAPLVLAERLAELRGRGRYGVRLLDRLLIDSGGESMLERRFLTLLRKHGVPRPKTRRRIRNHGHEVARVDFLYPARVRTEGAR